jgi:CheY-like chemotaxis protein
MATCAVYPCDECGGQHWGYKRHIKCPEEEKPMFTQSLVNRLNMPTKSILVCEDIVLQQSRIAEHFYDILPHEGNVEVNFVSGGKAAAAVIEAVGADVILLDHDMPNGSGPELLKWMAEREIDIPVVTFSGIPINNEHLMNLGAKHKFTKDEVITGAADSIILPIVIE